MGDCSKSSVNIGFLQFFAVVFQVFGGVYFLILYIQIIFNLNIIFLTLYLQENLQVYPDNG